MRLLVSLVLVCMIAACTRVPDADAIRATIGAMATAAEAKHSGDLLDHVASDFTGNDGEFDRAGLERMLRVRLLAGQTIGVSIGSIEVDVDGNRATARFTMTLTDGSGRWLPERRTELGMTTGWRREGRDWHCYNAKWTQG